MVLVLGGNKCYSHRIYGGNKLYWVVNELRQNANDIACQLKIKSLELHYLDGNLDLLGIWMLCKCTV